MGILFRESNYIDGSLISQFLAHFMAFFNFKDTLYPFLMHFRAKCHKIDPPKPPPYYGGSIFIHFALKCF